MAPTQDPPIGDLGEFSAGLRAGAFSAEQAVQACLRRIAEQDGTLRAFVHPGGDPVLADARAIDRRLAAGEDLGCLMGVPIAVKDLYTVSGMPVRAGSRVDVSGLVEPEGGFLRMLRAAGCVVLGKTRTTEFALGGVNLTHPTPWNPCDRAVHRVAGGSSSGSAVAVAAGLCAVGIGSDTGGSVRQPAALCGVVGYKASHGMWPVDGIFALSPTLDSVGWLTGSARDSAAVFATLRREHPVAPAHLGGLRLACPSGAFDDLEDSVGARIDHAIGVLRRSGAIVSEAEAPSGAELDRFAPIIPIELIARLTRDRIEASRELMDPVALARVDGVHLDAAEYLQLLARRRNLCRRVEHDMAGIDAWILPTTPDTATALAEVGDLPAVQAWNRRAFRNTRPANLLDQCAMSLPVRGGALPAGLQVACPHGSDRRLMEIALAIEQALAGAA